jgi:hypothetical protein
MAASRGYVINMPIPRDSDIKRGRGGRIFCFLLCLAAFVGFSSWMGSYVLSTLLESVGWESTGEELGSIIGMLIGGIVFGNFAPKRLLVTNDGLTGFYTTNTLAGELDVYGPGTHLSYPWEDRSKRDSFPLEVETLPFDVGVPTKTSGIIAKCELQWRYSLPRLVRAANLTEDTLKDGVEGFVDSVISAFVSPLTATTALTKVGDVNNLLRER